MLQHLRIRNLALMDETELEFGSGFIAVTGETGAGKSVLLGALSLLSGARVDKTIIRRGEDTCEVEAGLHFKDTTEVDAALKALELPVCDEGVLLLSRSLSRSKMPKIRINGMLTTLTNLQALGEAWIDFHGPGEPQKLFKERWQLELLDLYARNGSLLADYLVEYRAWRDILAKMDQLRNQEKLDPDERDFITTQIELIDRANLSEESIDALERDYRRYSQSKELISLANSVSYGLGGDRGVVDQIRSLIGASREISTIDEALTPTCDRLEALLIEAEDIGAEFGDVARDADIDPRTGKALEERMDLWMQLRRKHGNSVAAILEKRARLQEKLDMQGDIEGNLAKLEKEATTQKAKAEVIAEEIRLRRVQAAAELSRETAKLINSLGFKKAQLRIDINRTSDLTEYGNSACLFQFAPNAGQDFLPLHKIASSGEIARVMLSLKAVLATVDATPILVFDEVDANVGGEIASVVADLLAGLGAKHQVFCVTHLPQVASKAANHWVVRKTQDEQSTAITITPLHDKHEERKVELARMLGDRTSSTALQHAEDLLGAN